MDIGTFDNAGAAAPFFAIELLVQAHDIQARWQRCNMLANYIAEYVAYQFPEREWAENLISTVTNEFLEAVASLSPDRAELILRCTQSAGNLQIEIEHSVQPNAIQPYLTFLRELSGPTTDDTYFRLLTATERPELSFNQFGLVMLVHDFQASIAAELDDATSQIHIQVDVPTKEILA
jgi:hypothetical protein